MNSVRFVGAAVASLMVLLSLNVFVFPLVFPGGVASKFANTRETPLVALHLAAFLATAILLTALCAVPRRAGSSLAAAGTGAMAGLLAALPAALHTSAVAQPPVLGEVSAVLWTTITWALATAAAHAAYRWRRATWQRRAASAVVRSRQDLPGNRESGCHGSPQDTR